MFTKLLHLLTLFFLVTLFACTTTQTPLTQEPNPTNTPTPTNSNSYTFSGYTDIYPHGALGTNSLPTQIIITNPSGQQDILINLTDNQVFETNRILIQDITGDTTPEILLTVSDQDLGSTEIIYNTNGQEIARTDYIGQRFRWRHLLGVMQNDRGDKFLVDVVTPHLTGTLTLYQLQENQLIPIFQEDGYTSHQFSSPDLNLATITTMRGRDILKIPHQDGTDHYLTLEGNQFTLLDK